MYDLVRFVKQNFITFAHAKFSNFPNLLFERKFQLDIFPLFCLFVVENSTLGFTQFS